MSLLGYILLLTAASFCRAAPTASDDSKSCKKPDRRVEAELQGDWDAESYPENTEATFQCRPGYTRLGSIKMICKSGKWQTYTRGQCKKKSCGHPGDIPFGSFQLSNEESFIFGAVVEYFCDDGYQMVSRETKRQCTASGWSNYPPHCEVRNCPPIDNTDTINVISTSYDEEYSVGQVIRFECKDPKLKLDGPSEIFCTSEGKWNAEPPTCIEISCSVPGIDHGSVQNPRKVYSNNDVMQYTCERGFQANKNGQSTCTKDDWIPKPYCEEITCSPYEPVVNGKLVRMKNQYKFGDTIDVECDDGHVLQIEPNSPRECTANGWSPSTRCVSKKCDRPDIKYGIIGSDYYYPKDVGRDLWYYCERNYQPRQWTRIICTKAGWEPEPKCSRECLYGDANFENADLIGRRSVYVEGDKVQFRCRGNYLTPDGSRNGVRTCLPNGKFTPAKCSGTCTAPRLENGKINQIKKEYEIGEVLQYECNIGYMTESRHLSGKSQCRNGGWSEAPKCIPITCQYNDEFFLDGDIIKYSCPPGKKPRSDIGQCYYFGLGPPLVCQDIECTIPESSNLIRSPDTKTYKINRKVSFSCKEHFVRSGPLESVCTEGGWDPSLPTCEEEIMVQPQPTEQPSDGNEEKEETMVQPPPTEQPSDGIKEKEEIIVQPQPTEQPSDGNKEKDIRCTIPKSSNLISSPFAPSYEINTKVSFSCKERFVRSGSSESICTEGGWNPSLPTCKNIGCTIPKSSNLIPSSSARPYKINTKVSFSCKDRFNITRSLESVCTEGGWNPSLPTCKEEMVQPQPTDQPSDGNKEQEKRQKCPIAYSPQNAEIMNPKEEYYNNDVVTMRCGRGYKMHGSPKVRCVEGKWEQPPECIKVIQCNNPPTIENGIIESSKQEYASDDVVKYSCRPGFHISGSDQSTCLNGHWSTLPTCTEDACTEAPNIQHGKAIENKKSFSHGERAKYKCNNGFRIKDEDEASCVEGRWMNIPQCISTSCKSPPNVPNSKPKGETKSSYASGEKVTYVCNYGFSLEKTGEAQCDNTIWINKPVCRRIGEQCGPPPTVQFGDTVDIRKARYRSGERVEFRCPEYYILEGNRFVTCSNGVWNEAPVCIEPCTAKEKEMESNNIYFKWSPDRKLYSRHGQPIEFNCKPGYEALPETKMRITCDQGNLEYPKCFKIGFCVLQQSTMIANNIHYNLSTVVDHDQTILFQCNDGMMAETKLEAKCEWRQIVYPKCTAAKSCKTPEIQNGFLKTEPLPSYDTGSYVEFDCNEGYMINLALKVKCENGQWSKLPVCYSPCKISPEELTKHNIQLLSYNDQKNIPDKNYKHGTEISVACKSGFKRSNNAALVLECYDGKFRYPRCFSGSTCRILQDDLDENNLELDEVHDNEVFYAEGEKIYYKCKNGFYYSGRPTGTCSEQKISYPKCTEESSV